MILLSYEHLIKSNDFQFGFQSQSTTSLCSWVMYETIDQYVRKGSVVYGCLLDCTKAFDTVQHSTLFTKLLEASMPPIVVRLLIFVYRKQMANVRWKSSYSDVFPIRNGVRQGAIASPVLFCFYMDALFKQLKNCGSGCMISHYYAGIHGYADDLLLLCPSRSGLQEILDIASKYASDHKISFSTNSVASKSKTKGIVFSKKKLSFQPCPIVLNGNSLPWVENAKYLGNTITGILDGYSQDVKEKRAQFIRKNCELQQEFHLAHPDVLTKINRVYNSSFPGSVLWDLTSSSTSKLINSWTVAIKHMWSLPFEAHRYLAEGLGGMHAYTMLMLRYVKFINSVKKSPKIAVQYLYQKVKKDVETVTGRNIAYILKLSGYDDIEKINLRDLSRTIKFETIKKEEKWKLDMIQEVVNIKKNVLTLDNMEDSLDEDEFNDIIHYLSTS